MVSSVCLRDELLFARLGLTSFGSQTDDGLVMVLLYFDSGKLVSEDIWHGLSSDLTISNVSSFLYLKNFFKMVLVRLVLLTVYQTPNTNDMEMHIMPDHIRMST